MTRSLLWRVPSGVLASVVALCIANDAHSLWTPGQIVSGALLGPSPVCCGKPGLTGGNAALFRTRVLLLCPRFCLWPFFRTCEAGSFCFIFSHLSWNPSIDVISLIRWPPQKKEVDVLLLRDDATLRKTL